MIIEVRKIGKFLSLVLAGAFLLFIIFQLPWVQRLRYPMPYKGSVQKYATQYGVDPYLVTAVIREESKFMPKAQSKAGAKGLMQLMPETAQWAADKAGLNKFQEELLFEPDANIRLGSWYIANLSQQFQNNTVLVLAAYNGGSGRVKDWLDRGQISPSGKVAELPILETKEYVKRVLKSYAKYRQLYPDLNF
ncbi:MAG TPA: lytic transglycosylase domain-containing protein [Candidatus Deferrimicrobium sp.]|nr:lytic transglycosylase domain-containing protein [Candidatus Deferrimicrobium sp.]